MSKIINDNKYFGEYLTGLFEGDGYIWIPTELTLSKKKHNPRFTITFHKNNEKLALLIKKKLGDYGFIRQKIRENAVVLTISEIKGLLVILQFLHNNLKTPKIRQVNELIYWLNLYKNYNLQLEKLSSKLINKETAWLCGFVEADGCFFIRLSSNKKQRRIGFRFSIDQRIIDKKTGDDYFLIMEEIGSFLKTKVKIINRKKNNYSYYSISSYNLINLKLIINYFNKFLLLGTKSLDFMDWSRSYYIYINRKKITEELFITIKDLKIQMNSQRINFDYNLE